MVVTLRGGTDEIDRALAVLTAEFYFVHAFERRATNSMGEFQQAALVLDRELASFGAEDENASAGDEGVI